MNNAGGALTVNGDASFSALDDGGFDLTNGTLQLKGNFSAANYGTAFRATGAHLTRFIGTGAQSIYFQYSGGGQSQFANLEITNSSGAGVTPTTNVTVAGNLNQLGTLTITSVAMNVGGNVTLGATSITNATGGALNHPALSCSFSGVASFPGVTCP